MHIVIFVRSSPQSLFPYPTIKMWKIPNENAFPSKEEILTTRSTICDLETKLIEARQTLMQAQRAVDLLEEELLHQKNWISPVRRITYDLLSIVFLRSCEEDWKALFSLGGVCRLWRQTVLSSPRIWSLIHLERITAKEAVPVIIQRGGSWPIHLTLGKDFKSEFIEELTKSPQRIKCLVTDCRHWSILSRGFSNLTKLVIIDGFIPAAASMMLLDAETFPNLRCLRVRALFDSTISLPFPITFPPIEEFSVETHVHGLVAGIIRRLAPELTRLCYVCRGPHIGLLDPNPDGDPEALDFPKLIHLSIVDVRAQPGHWPFIARTPLLQVYGEHQEFFRHRYNQHKDTKSVKTLLFGKDIDMSLFPELWEVRALHAGVAKLLSDLESEPEIWPNLNIVVCSQDDIADRPTEFGRQMLTFERDILDKRVNDFNKTNARKIILKFQAKACGFASLTALSSVCDLTL